MNDNDTPARIAGQSLALFKTFGIRKVSMDAIASECKISKKTIYKLFRDKNHLLSEVLELKYSSLYQKVLLKAGVQENPIGELGRFCTHLEKEMAVSSGLFYHDLKKYHSANYSRLLQLKNQLISDFLSRNIDRGIKESLYKTEETENLVKLYCFTIESLFVSAHAKDNPQEKSRLLNTFNQLFISNLTAFQGLEYHKGNSTK